MRYDELPRDKYLDDSDTYVDVFDEEDDDDFYEDSMSDAEADADTFASAGWGTDEDYGWFGEQGLWD